MVCDVCTTAASLPDPGQGLFFYTRYQGIKDPKGFGKKIEANCRSDHYSGQSSNTKESCSSTTLNRCASTETRWNHRRQPRRGCQGRIPTNILVGGDINGNVPTNIRGGNVVEYELLIASVKRKPR